MSDTKLSLAANECNERDLWRAAGHDAAAQDARNRIYPIAERILADECPQAGTKEHSHLPRTLAQVRWANGVSREYAERMIDETGVPYGWLGLKLS